MKIRPFLQTDAPDVDALALRAFDQFAGHYRPWGEFRARIAHMSAMPMEIWLAEEAGRLLGAVGLVPPGQGTDARFSPDWAVIRMLVVDPAHRGIGLGRGLTECCIDRARNLGAKAIGLHTSPIMEVALGLYLRMGFKKMQDIDDIYGVPYAIYKLDWNRDLAAR